MKIRVNNKRLPGIMAERVDSKGEELSREDVYLFDQYIGTILSVKRRGILGSEYGWRPEGPVRFTLTDKASAIEKLTILYKQKREDSK